MFLNIVTPCTRITNLPRIAESLKTIPEKQRRWIVVFDSPKLPEICPKEAECFAYWRKGSGAGNAQRNYALDLIKKGHIYFNDDDTEIHPLLWNNVKDLDDHDFISFSQVNKDGTARLRGDRIVRGHIDSHNFIVSRECMGDTRWDLRRYDSDGMFAEDCYRRAESSIFIPIILSVYNSLR